MRKTALALLLTLCPAPAPAAGTVAFVRDSLKPEALGGLELQRRRPLRAEGKRLPAVILFGGFETGAQAIELFDPAAPVELLTFEYPFSPPRKLGFPGGLRHAATAKAAIHETIAGIDKLVSWAAEQPGTDPSAVVLVGASFGSPFVSIAAARNPKASALILAHGFARVPLVISSRLGDALERLYGTPGRWLGTLLGRLLWWYAAAPEPADSLRTLKPHQQVLLLTAENDDLIPAGAVDAVRESVAGSQASWEERRIPGGHLRPGARETVQLLLGESMSWMRRRELLR